MNFPFSKLQIFVLVPLLIVAFAIAPGAECKDVLDSVNTMGPSTLSTDDRPDEPTSPAVQHQQAAAAACRTAESYAAYGRWQAAIQVLDQVIAQDERNEVAHYELSVACTKVGDYKRASDEVNRAIQLNSRYADAYVQLGAIRAKLGDLTGSEKAYLRAIQIDPTLHQTKDGAAVRSLEALRRGVSR